MEKRLQELMPEIKIFFFEELDSTNSKAAELARTGEDGVFIVAARRQSSGRGRMGRSFYSGEGGLYMSLVLRPHSSESATLLTTAAAVAAAEAIEALSGEKAEIKWVNDIFLRGRKVCGILAEGSFSPGATSPDFAVVGIGVNVTEPESGFPDDIREIAGAVLSRGGANHIAELAADIVRRFLPLCGDLESRGWYENYLRRLNCLDRPVTVRQGEITRSAAAVALDRDFRLLVRFDEGGEQWLSFGEISIRQ
ncbi:MAG: biotin--[Oscillospiraceae bacterium]|nr:biotin--[acetyl-CoA-carboxylase] ligase [Oscillospiraceae bacterium]